MDRCLPLPSGVFPYTRLFPPKHAGTTWSLLVVCRFRSQAGNRTGSLSKALQGLREQKEEPGIDFPPLAKTYCQVYLRCLQELLKVRQKRGTAHLHQGSRETACLV